MHKVERYIAAFEKKGSRFLVKKMRIPSEDLEYLKTIFEVKADDPCMYDYYDLSEELAEKLVERYGFEFSFSEFDYALGAEAA
ncbi:DUF7683 domain-containing protein [Agrobacterium salinitolerans]|uniref:DUF7683 domain-containing protein n=1 Tax=Agrobacterium salinitolerans TaxID=1183413 RepID=UPI00174820CA